MVLGWLFWEFVLKPIFGPMIDRVIGRVVARWKKSK